MVLTHEPLNSSFFLNTAWFIEGSHRLTSRLSASGGHEHGKGRPGQSHQRA